jgi:Zn-dependent protease
MLAAIVLFVGRGYEEGIGDLTAIALLAVLVLPTVMIHEISHGWVAFRLGDPTAKERGRLTFNPLKHVSFRWTVLFPMTVYYFFKVPLILPKPVPINPRRFLNPRKSIMWVGLAGPAVNIFLMLLFAVILGSGGIRDAGVGRTVRQLLMVLVVLNMGIATFNLIPIPPLDGSRLLIGILPARQSTSLIRMERLGLLFIFAVVIATAMSVGLDRVAIPVIEFGLRALGLNVGEFRQMLAE